MQFMMLFKGTASEDPEAVPCKQNLPEMQKLIKSLSQTGVLLSTQGLIPRKNRARVQYDGGKLSVSDGPFAETKELLAGVAVVKVASREEAVSIAQQFLRIAGEGESEIFQIMES